MVALSNIMEGQIKTNGRNTEEVVELASPRNNEEISTDGQNQQEWKAELTKTREQMAHYASKIEQLKKELKEMKLKSQRDSNNGGDRSSPRNYDDAPDQV